MAQGGTQPPFLCYNKYITNGEPLMEMVIGESVKKTNRTLIKSYTEDYCKAITENYRMYHIDSLTRDNHPSPEYAQQQLDEIENGTANLMKFEIKEGKKYYKIVQMEFETWEKSQFYGQYREGSVHAFVDKNTGEVYMAASWSKPAKHVRFDLRIIKERNLLHDPNFVTWSTGYLYIR